MKKLRLVTLIAILCFSVNQLFSQTESTSIIKPFGIGLHIEQFKINDISDLEMAPANKIVFTISPLATFRIEPEIGFKYGKDKESENKVRFTNIGFGMYAMAQKNKLNFYYGIKLELGVMKVIEKEFTDEYTYKTNRTMLGPVVGVEYYLGENFTFGGEFGFKYVKTKSTIDPTPTGFEDDENTYYTTDSGLFIRFYF
ncbi:MAG: hypothetical protein AB9846_03145 [Tenuifilaceae bacterium]